MADTKEKTMSVVKITQTGTADALIFDQKFPVPKISPKQCLVKVAVAGINFIDTYQRSGLYAVPLPFVLGREAAGVVTEVGAEVKEFKVGSRVAFFAGGAYADYTAVDEKDLLSVPDNVKLADAGAAVLQGLTAHYLVNTTYKVQPGDSVLISAGAGGTGQLLIQMAKAAGARVITTVGSAAKQQICKDLGADLVINYSEQDWVAEVKRFTNNAGCQAVYDGVGAATWDKSLKCCAPLGHLVLFGNASGKVPPIDPLSLTSAGSVSLTRPSLAHYIASRQALLQRANDLFSMMSLGKLKVSIGKTFPLSQAADAHRYLESRASTGKVLLVIDDKLAAN